MPTSPNNNPTIRKSVRERLRKIDNNLRVSFLREQGLAALVRQYTTLDSSNDDNILRDFLFGVWSLRSSQGEDRTDLVPSRDFRPALRPEYKMSPHSKMFADRINEQIRFK